MVSKKSVAPFFTIVTCTKNSAKFLKECLASVSSQTFRDFEHIAIDGKSSDGTTAMLRAAGVTTFVMPPRGIATAMNEGIAHARGKYIYFLHSDDQLAGPDVLQRVHDYLMGHKELDWAYGQIEEVDGEGRQVGIFPTRRIFQAPRPWLLWLYNYIPHQGVFMKREVFTRLGNFDPRYRIAMDYDLWLRVAQRTYWRFFPVVVAKYRVHEGAVSATPALRARRRKEKIALRLRNLFRIQ